MAKNLSIVAQGISGDAGHLLGYNVTDNGIYTPAIGDVARDTTATYVAQDGTIKTAAENVARVDYTNGVAELLLEPTSTNLIINSEPTTSPARATNEPFNWANGFTTCDKYIGGVSGTQYRYNQMSGFVSGVSATFSFYILMDDGSKPIVGANNSTTADLTISIGGTITYQECGSNIWRISAYRENNTNPNVGVIKYDSQTQKGFRVVGFQYEVLPYATSYIPTNGSTEQRGADSVTNAGDSSTFNSESGVLFFQGTPSTNLVGLSLSDNSNSNLVYIEFNINQIYVALASSGFGNLNINTSTDAISNVKVSVSWSQDLVNVYINGVKFYENTSFNTLNQGSLTTLKLKRGDNQRPFQGKTKSIQHWDYLTDEEMESLTGYQSYAQMTQQFNFNTL